MKNLTLPVMEKKFIERLGKTVINCNHNDRVVSVWANGDITNEAGLLCNVVINEIGDTFVAAKDSSRKDKDGKPLYKQGETVTRQLESCEFKQLTGKTQATEFAAAASAFGLNLTIQMGAV